MTSWLRSWARLNKGILVAGVWLVIAVALLAAVAFPLLFVVYFGIFVISILTFLIYIFVDVFTDE